MSSTIGIWATHFLPSRILGQTILFLCLLVTFSAVLLSTTQAFAQATPAAPPIDSTPSQSRAIAAVPGSCPQGGDFTGPVVAQCDCYPGLVNRVVGCIRQTLHNAATIFFDPNKGIHGLLAKAIAGIITLSIAIYGAMVVSGLTEKLGRDTFTLLLKIALISYFVVNTEQLYNLILTLIDTLADSMFRFSSVSTLGVCMNKLSVWERIDCMIDSVIGIRTAAITSNDFQGFNENFAGDNLERGLLAVFFELMKSSSFGFVIGLIGFIFIYTMLFFVVKVVFTFIMSFISLTFLMMLGPLFIPLVLFRSSKQYFDKWIRLIISSALQPIVLTAFITFSVAAMDLALFTGPTSITKVIAGFASDRPGFTLAAYIDPYIIRKSAQGAGIKGESNVEDFKRITGSIKGVLEATKSTCLRNPIGFITPKAPPGTPDAEESSTAQDFIECSKEQVLQLPYDAIDLQALASAREPFVVDPSELAGLDLEEQWRVLEQRLTQELFASAIIALMIMFLLQSLMRVVPVMSNDLTGEVRYTPSLFIGGESSGLGSALTSQISSGISSLTSKVKS